MRSVHYNPTTLDSYDFLDALLYFSLAPGDRRFTSQPQVLYQQLCDTVVEYVTESEPRFEPSYREKALGYLWEQLKETLAVHRLQPRLTDALENLLAVSSLKSVQGCEYVYRYWDHYSTQAITDEKPARMKPETQEYVTKKVVPALSAAEQQELLSLGRLLRKYIKRSEEW